MPHRKKQHTPDTAPPNKNRPVQSTYIVSCCAGQYGTRIGERLPSWLTPIQTDITYVFELEETALRDEVSPLPSPYPVTCPGYSDAPWILEAKGNTVLWLS